MKFIFYTPQVPELIEPYVDVYKQNYFTQTHIAGFSLKSSNLRDLIIKNINNFNDYNDRIIKEKNEWKNELSNIDKMKKINFKEYNNIHN